LSRELIFHKGNVLGLVSGFPRIKKDAKNEEFKKSGALKLIADVVVDVIMAGTSPSSTCT